MSYLIVLFWTESCHQSHRTIAWHSLTFEPHLLEFGKSFVFIDNTLAFLCKLLYVHHGYM